MYGTSTSFGSSHNTTYSHSTTNSSQSNPTKTYEETRRAAIEPNKFLNSKERHQKSLDTYEIVKKAFDRDK